jgi:hypothetical protein
VKLALVYWPVRRIKDALPNLPRDTRIAYSCDAKVAARKFSLEGWSGK